jgi:DNA-binding Lrp family transcriptional regulator
MPSMKMNAIDTKLLVLTQKHFPLTTTPFDDLGRELAIGSGEVIQRIQGLKDCGIIRQISPVLDARKLGYQSTLAAMKLPEEHFIKAQQIINGHSGISHAYQRNHDFNLWITLSVRTEASLEAELDELALATGAREIMALPALKVFKLQAYFGQSEDDKPETAINAPARNTTENPELSQLDKVVINEFQQDLPLISEPFNPLALRLNIKTEELLKVYQYLLQSRIMRRFGAAVNHRQAGYQANAMACWVVTKEKLEFAGQMLSSFREVSHCYERMTNPAWKYNLFAMIHGHTQDECLSVVNKVASETNLREQIVLFSTRELKKTRIKYQV